MDSHLQIVHLEALNLVHVFVNLLPPKPHNYIVQVNTDNAALQQVFELTNCVSPVACLLHLNFSLASRTLLSKSSINDLVFPLGGLNSSTTELSACLVACLVTCLAAC